MSSIFRKILAKEIPGNIIYQNDRIFVLEDINPEDTTHLLIIPKEEIISIIDLDENNINIIGEMYLVAKKVAIQQGVEQGYELRINVGDYQKVPHIHMHLISKY